MIPKQMIFIIPKGRCWRPMTHPTTQGQSRRWFLFNAESVPVLDLTGAGALEELHAELASQGIVRAVARAKGRFWMMLDRSDVTEKSAESICSRRFMPAPKRF
jgi:hypothetical protein